MKYNGKDVEVKKEGKYTKFVHKDQVVKSFIDVNKEYKEKKKQKYKE